MLNLMTPFWGRKQFLMRQRPICLRSLVRRYQLMELVGLTAAIALIWFGVHLDNQFSSAPARDAVGAESASADLITGVPVGKHRSL